MKRFLNLFLIAVITIPFYGQTNTKIKQMEEQRSQIDREISESEQLLTSAGKSVNEQLAALSALSAQIEKQQQYVKRIGADINATNIEIKKIEEQLVTLEVELDRRRDHYAHALQLMSRKNTFENRLMFLLSAESFNQMIRRMRYLREYSGFQQKQGELLIKQQQELDDKRVELENSRKSAQALLIKQKEEQAELNKRKSEQNSLVASLRKKQKDIRNRIAKQQEERDRLNNEINRMIEAEIAAQEAKRRQKETESQMAQTSETGETNEKMPVFHENAADRKLSGSFQSNKSKLPVPLTGPYLVTSHYGVNYVEGLKNVKYNNHGVDVRGQMNCSARAIFDGTVSAIFQHPGREGSFIVMIRHGQYISAYFNLTNLKVKIDDKVKINQPIGLIHTDTEGNYTLQFQLRQGTQSLNPEQWIAF